MKKVLFVFNHPAPYKVRLFNELAKYFEMHVIFEKDENRDRPKNFYFENDYKFIQHKIKGIGLGNENVFSFGIVKHLKRNKYDLIVMNGYSSFAEMLAIRYLNKNKIPFVFYINGGIIDKNESVLKRKLKTKYISSAKYFMSPDLESNKYLEYYGANTNNIFNYPYSSLMEKEILSEPITDLEKLGLKTKHGIQFEKVFVSSGQLIKRKNYLELVENWKNEPSNYGLIILGDGNQRTRINNYINKNNIRNVKLLGFKKREEMFEYFKLSDAFIFSSKEDIYGHVIPEALSQGLPVISTCNVNSAKLLVKNDFNGYLLNQLSENEIETAINSVISGDFSKNCLNSVANYTIEKTAESNRKIFEEILSK